MLFPVDLRCRYGIYTGALPGVDLLTVHMRNLLPITRLARVAIAVITVWCLGCESFESLAGSVDRTSSSRMNCGSDQTGSAVPSISDPVAAEAGGSSHDRTVRALDENDPGSYSCSCSSCSSVSPVTIAFALSPVPAPEVILTSAPLFESVKREPLVPPPQLLS